MIMTLAFQHSGADLLAHVSLGPAAAGSELPSLPPFNPPVGVTSSGHGQGWSQQPPAHEQALQLLLRQEQLKQALITVLQLGAQEWDSPPAQPSFFAGQLAPHAQVGSPLAAQWGVATPAPYPHLLPPSPQPVHPPWAVALALPAQQEGTGVFLPCYEAAPGDQARARSAGDRHAGRRCAGRRR